MNTQTSVISDSIYLSQNSRDYVVRVSSAKPVFLVRDRRSIRYELMKRMCWSCSALCGYGNTAKPISTSFMSRSITTKQMLGKNTPLPTNSPDSLQFEPRPIENARYEDYYNSVIAPDLLTMTYTQHTKGQMQSTRTNALRTWDGSSPYHKNRPLRPLRGNNKVLKPLPEMRTFRNVPKIEAIYVHTMVKQALLDRSSLLPAVMALQSITGQKPEIINARKGVAPWKLRAGVPVATKVKLQGAPMYQFLATLIEVVLPSLKDFTGISEATGDTNGNIGFGLPPSAMARFPEIEGMILPPHLY